MSQGSLTFPVSLSILLVLGCGGGDMAPQEEELMSAGGASLDGAGGGSRQFDAMGGQHTSGGSDALASGGSDSLLVLGADGGATEEQRDWKGDGGDSARAASGGQASEGAGGNEAVEDNEGAGGNPQTGGMGNLGEEDCPFAGDVRYELNNPDAWPEGVEELLTSAMDEATYYYNCYSDLSHRLTVNYNASVQTAEANVNGVISFGESRSYMVTATAMHEMGHTMGVSFYPWDELIENMRWTGEAVSEYMQALPAEERDPDEYSQRDYITADGLHFWPYGLNQAAEHQSEWSLINHVRIVAALQKDKAAFLAQ